MNRRTDAEIKGAIDRVSAEGPVPLGELAAHPITLDGVVYRPSAQCLLRWGLYSRRGVFLDVCYVQRLAGWATSRAALRRFAAGRTGEPAAGPPSQAQPREERVKARARVKADSPVPVAELFADPDPGALRAVVRWITDGRLTAAGGRVWLDGYFDRETARWFSSPSALRRFMDATAAPAPAGKGVADDRP